MLDVTQQTTGKRSIRLLACCGVHQPLASFDQPSLDEHAIDRVFRSGQSIAVPGENDLNLVPPACIEQHGFQPGPLHVAAADRVIAVNLGENPAARLGERGQLRALLIQRFLLLVG